MSDGFANPIVGGGGALVYPSVHSPDFVPSVSGWTINKDGSAEFDNLSIRGTFNGTDYVINSSGTFFYSGTPAAGNLIASESNTQGDDGEGNYFLKGFTSYVPAGGGGYVASQLVDGTIAFWFAANMVSVANPWTTLGGIDALNGTPNVLQVAGGPNASDYIAMASLVKVTGGFHYSGPIVGYAPSSTTDETWHAVTVPTGMTGAIRVKVLAEQKTALLDVNVTITSTNATGTTYTAGSLPSAAYYPTGLRKFPLSTDTNLAAAVSTPRVHIPASGAVLLLIPAYNAAGGTAVVSGTVFYPLD